MDILLFGPKGKVGWELQRSLASLGQVIPVARQGRDGMSGDLTDPKSLSATIQALSPDIIVNAAAYTNVDQAESEPGPARTVNARSLEVMAQEALMLDALLVHYSTDYVFSGAGSTPWHEDDSPEPANVYGLTKLEGEKAVRGSGCRHLIFRTSWVYALYGRSFLQTMLKLACAGKGLRVVDDQFGAPTGAELIADVTAHALRTVQKDKDLCGTYHLAAAGETTWYDYTRLVISTAVEIGINVNVSAQEIVPVSSEEFPTPAPRPLNSRLNTSRLESTFGLCLPPWQEGVVRVLRELQAASCMAQTLRVDQMQ
jgi:dTDP-4-dehydrorhamnose reductase